MVKFRSGIFNKISTIDIFVIIVCIVIIGIFYIVFNRYVTTVVVRFKITDDSPLYAKTLPGNEYASHFMVGDTEKDELGRTISEIVGIESYKINPDQTVVYLDIKMKAVYNPRKKQYSSQGKNIAFGETFLFSFSKIKFRALAVDFPGFLDKKTIKPTKTIIRAQLRDSSRYFSDTYGIQPFIANAVKKNDIVTNSKGDILLKILDVSIKPATRTIINNTNAYQQLDPELKDVYYTIELSTKRLDDQMYMFDYQLVLIGALVPINLPTVSVFPTITEIL